MPLLAFPGSWLTRCAPCRLHPVGSMLREVHDVFGLRRLRQEAALRHAAESLAPPHEAALEPEHPARAGSGRRVDEAGERLHVVPQGRQGPEARLARLTPLGASTREHFIVRTSGAPIAA